jgi:hypothetical protein
MSSWSFSPGNSRRSPSPDPPMGLQDRIATACPPERPFLSNRRERCFGFQGYNLLPSLPYICCAHFSVDVSRPRVAFSTAQFHERLVCFSCQLFNVFTHALSASCDHDFSRRASEVTSGFELRTIVVNHNSDDLMLDFDRVSIWRTNSRPGSPAQLLAAGHRPSPRAAAPSAPSTGRIARSRFTFAGQRALAALSLA